MSKITEITSGKYSRLCASAGVVLALIAGVAIHSSRSDSVPADAGASAPRVNATEIVDRHLAWADGQGNAEQSVQPVRELFSEARLGSRRFAAEALSLTSKWKVLTDFLTDGQDHKAFLNEQFVLHIFPPEALEAVVQQAIAGHMRQLDDVDSELLVRLKSDLASMPNLEFLAGIDRPVIQASLDAAVRQAAQAVQAELLPGAGLELVSYVAGEVLTSATFSLGASTGILSAGAASGVVSLGVGLVVGIIVDAVISWAYDAMYDPVGQLATRIDQTLFELEETILKGSNDAPGLISRLQDYGARRSHARNATIRSVVTPGSAGGDAVLAF